jgi:hypothetical protein
MTKTPEVHFHIRWSSRNEVDWEPFRTFGEARSAAAGWVRAGETYVIEHADENCARCAEAQKAQKLAS